MKKITCNVIQDLITLNADDLASEDSKRLVEEHIRECDSCRRAFEKTNAELKEQETSPKDDAGNKRNADGLRSFKKFLFKKKIRTILISAIASAILIIGTEMYMNWKTTYIDYEDAGIKYFVENNEEVLYKTNIDGGYHTVFSLDTETGISVFHFEQNLWEKYVSGMIYQHDHIHGLIKKDMIEQWYMDADGNMTLIWEASEAEKEMYFSPDRDKSLG